MFKKQKFNKNKLILSLVLIAFAVSSRIFLQDVPNVETITVTALLAGSILGGVYALVIPLTAIALTDIWIGNNPILLFTWSAWAMVGLGGLLLRKEKKDSFKYALKMTGLGLGASLLFYLWTNFGVWLTWPKLYPMTWPGLLQCYLMGLPFFKYNLLGNLVIILVISSSLVIACKATALGKMIKQKSHARTSKM